MRIFETSRRHPGRTGPVAGTVLLERALGGAATVTLAAVGFALAVGRYDVGRVHLDRGARSSIGTVVLAVLLFSTPRASPARVVRAAAAQAADRAPAALGVRGDPRVPRPSAAARLASSR